ncbi:MAG: helix-turn-helix domain-containing protein [Candidatus Acidiferrales bacterium]
MESDSIQLGMRENTASQRLHDSRVATQSATATSASLSAAQEDLRAVRQSFPPALAATSSKDAAYSTATGREKNGTITSELIGEGKRSSVERPLTCDEAAALVRVHPKTVKRMARSGELPGHFRFGRWFFYASELDCWMRTELHSSRHSCR